MRFSINCSTVICSPTVILMLSWEKPLVKPMAPGSIFYHISFPSTFICIFYFPIYIIKIPKIFILLLSLSDLTCASGREGIDNSFISLDARFLFVCVGTRDLHVASYWIDTLVLKNWGKYLRYFAISPFPLQGKTNACSRGSKKDFWHHCRGGLRKSQHTKYPSHTLISRITLFAICLSFSSPPLHPCRFIRLLFCLPFACQIYCLLVLPCAFYLLASLLAKNLLIWIHLKCSTWIIFDPYVLVLKPQPA